MNKNLFWVMILCGSALNGMNETTTNPFLPPSLNTSMGRSGKSYNNNNADYLTATNTQYGVPQYFLPSDYSNVSHTAKYPNDYTAQQVAVPHIYYNNKELCRDLMNSNVLTDDEKRIFTHITLPKEFPATLSPIELQKLQNGIAKLKQREIELLEGDRFFAFFVKHSKTQFSLLQGLQVGWEEIKKRSLEIACYMMLAVMSQKICDERDFIGYSILSVSAVVLYTFISDGKSPYCDFLQKKVLKLVPAFLGIYALSQGSLLAKAIATRPVPLGMLWILGVIWELGNVVQNVYNDGCKRLKNDSTLYTLGGLTKEIRQNKNNK